MYELPPNTQGATVLEMLNILEGFDLKSIAEKRDRPQKAEKSRKRDRPQNTAPRSGPTKGQAKKGGKWPKWRQEEAKRVRMGAQQRAKRGTGQNGRSAGPSGRNGDRPRNTALSSGPKKGQVQKGTMGLVFVVRNRI